MAVHRCSGVDGLQGAILLIAAKGQDGISVAVALHDFETDTAAKQEIDRPIQLSEQQLAIIVELQLHLRSGQVDGECDHGVPSCSPLEASGPPADGRTDR